MVLEVLGCDNVFSPKHFEHVGKSQKMIEHSMNALEICGNTSAGAGHSRKVMRESWQIAETSASFGKSILFACFTGWAKQRISRLHVKHWIESWISGGF